jgi:hypothetical protein
MAAPDRMPPPNPKEKELASRGTSTNELSSALNTSNEGPAFSEKNEAFAGKVWIMPPPAIKN